MKMNYKYLLNQSLGSVIGHIVGTCVILYNHETEAFFNVLCAMLKLHFTTTLNKHT